MPYRLVDKLAGTLDLTPENGYAVSSIDLGYPDVREVSEPIVNGNGVYDATAYVGARAVTMQLTAFPVPGRSRFQVVQRLAKFASPNRRPYLYFDPDFNGTWYRMGLRGAALGAPIISPLTTSVSVGWSAPSGLYESAEATKVTVTPGATLASGGATFPLIFPLVFGPPGESMAPGALVNPGTEPSAAIYRMYGPVTGPRLREQTSGQLIHFPSYPLPAASDYIEVDTAKGTATRATGRSVYAFMDTLNSTLFNIRAADDPLGPTRVSYDPETAALGARAEVIYRSTYI